MGKQKFYVVWDGVTPGIYTSWTECQLQVKGYDSAKYKSFDNREEAERAFAASPYAYIGKNAKKKTTGPSTDMLPVAVIENSLAVDAACSGNPGPMEYRGVHVASRQEIFHFGPMKGTNNIGEFLALVHGLALLKQKGFDMPIYSDSANAISWHIRLLHYPPSRTSIRWWNAIAKRRFSRCALKKESESYRSRRLQAGSFRVR